MLSLEDFGVSIVFHVDSGSTKSKEYNDGVKAEGVVQKKGVEFKFSHSF